MGNKNPIEASKKWLVECGYTEAEAENLLRAIYHEDPDGAGIVFGHGRRVWRIVFQPERQGLGSRPANGVEAMNGQWNWLIGRKLSLGEVVDVFGESATVRHGDDETRVLLCELLEEDYNAQDRYEKDLNEAWNTGDGSYRP